MPRRIAIVEDDAAIRANTADALKKHGYEVSAYAARGEALGAFRARLPDLALIDIGLGDEPDGGFALCRELRALSPALPILCLTAAWKDKPVGLTLTEFWMVHTLAKFPGHVKDRDALMREANLVVDEGTVTTHVKRIRKKFAAVDPAFDQIDTVYGMGYRWKA